MTLMVRPWTAAKWPELLESCRCACRCYSYRHEMVEEHEDDGPPRWSDPPGPVYKALGWGCLAILLVPFLLIIYVFATFCENNCS